MIKHLATVGIKKKKSLLTGSNLWQNQKLSAVINWLRGERAEGEVNPPKSRLALLHLLPSPQHIMC